MYVANISAKKTRKKARSRFGVRATGTDGRWQFPQEHNKISHPKFYYIYNIYIIYIVIYNYKYFSFLQNVCSLENCHLPSVPLCCCFSLSFAVVFSVQNSPLFILPMYRSSNSAVLSGKTREEMPRSMFLARLSSASLKTARARSSLLPQMMPFSL